MQCHVCVVYYLYSNRFIAAINYHQTQGCKKDSKEGIRKTREWNRAPLQSSCTMSYFREILYKVGITFDRCRATMPQAILIFSCVLYYLPISPIFICNSLKSL